MAQTNANVPAGRVQWFDQEQSIRVVGSRPSLADLANLPIALSDYRKVKLAELATISDSHADVRSRTRLNGREVLGFQVFRSKGSSDTVVEKGVQQALQRLAVNYPDIQMAEVHNSVNTTKENYDVAIATLLEGAALTVLVVWLFLRNWRATLVAAIALPLSILPAFWIMQLLGYTLNSISLLAITLVIGILVDDAIVEIENIETHIHLVLLFKDFLQPLTILTALPLSIGGAAFRAPMAIAVICGLTASTLLSLVFVPVVYSLMDDLRKWLAPKLAKLTSVTVEDRERE